MHLIQWSKKIWGKRIIVFCTPTLCSCRCVEYHRWSFLKAVYIGANACMKRAKISHYHQSILQRILQRMQKWLIVIVIEHKTIYIRSACGMCTELYISQKFRSKRVIQVLVTVSCPLHCSHCTHSAVLLVMLSTLPSTIVQYSRELPETRGKVVSVLSSLSPASSLSPDPRTWHIAFIRPG